MNDNDKELVKLEILHAIRKECFSLRSEAGADIVNYLRLNEYSAREEEIKRLINSIEIIEVICTVVYGVLNRGGDYPDRNDSHPFTD